MSGVKIEVDISNATSSASGKMQHIIKDTERPTFGLSDAGLKDAVGAYFGKRPKDAFLRSPTPWGDMYITYGWKEVRTTLIPVKTTIRQANLVPVILSSKKLINSSSIGATFEGSISHSVSNSVTNSWSNTNNFTFEHKVTATIGFPGLGITGGPSMVYSKDWGESFTDTTITTAGSAAGVSVFLNPGEAVDVVLYAERGSMVVDVEYRTYLTGQNANNYYPKYKNHHFWAFQINAVMLAGNLSNSLTTTQQITIGYYANDRIELKDPETGAVKSMIPCGSLFADQIDPGQDQ